MYCLCNGVQSLYLVTVTTSLLFNELKILWFVKKAVTKTVQQSFSPFMSFL